MNHSRMKKAGYSACIAAVMYALPHYWWGFAIGSVLLSLWGFTYFVMQYLLAVGRVRSAPMYADQDASPMAVWRYFWYALFLIWGISLGAAAYYAEKVCKQNKSNRFTK
ncbi:hypothetical protein [Paenibacillus sp. MDMC362]|uniref:hypothetical protein n=1 Tax=Paenibacillus sp. MDMC362 TaxID=2977365 RepID=UPI000DC553DE|nr:hypothetical protein [Paenibacillus sp. MDMC362]RAR43628.1 hypothetical protein DP091_12125 [Paenibacillus sp. MDMC362]